MKTEARDLAIVIEFEQKDWQNGLARHMMSRIKQLPYTSRKYNGEEKSWHIMPTQKNRKMLLDTYEQWEANLPYHWDSKEDEEADDIKDFLEQFN
jgi:hypothetical protein